MTQDTFVIEHSSRGVFVGFHFDGTVRKAKFRYSIYRHEGEVYYSKAEVLNKYRQVLPFAPKAYVVWFDQTRKHLSTYPFILTMEDFVTVSK